MSLDEHLTRTQRVVLASYDRLWERQQAALDAAPDEETRLELMLWHLEQEREYDELWTPLLDRERGQLAAEARGKRRQTRLHIAALAALIVALTAAVVLL